ncbi:MAG: response regulator transcription factor [Rhodobacteraceae bacterium]|nr:response regulator transcription factor [Paracoccaceae bacterium]
MYVILADDHSLIRDALRPYLDMIDPGVEIAEAETFESVIAYAGGKTPDLILLDLNMPGMRGTYSVSEVRGSFPDSLIAILSATDDAETISAALRNGANGYIPKTTRGKSLLNAIQLILDGETYVPPSLLNNLPTAKLAELSGNGQARDLPGALHALTSREAMVLKLLISGKSNKEIARELDLQEVTVKVHLRNVYRKINANNRTDAVRIALSYGDPSMWAIPSTQT